MGRGRLGLSLYANQHAYITGIPFESADLVEDIVNTRTYIIRKTALNTLPVVEYIKCCGVAH